MTQKGAVVLLTLQEKSVVWKSHFTLFNNFAAVYHLFDRKQKILEMHISRAEFRNEKTYIYALNVQAALLRTFEIC